MTESAPTPAKLMRPELWLLVCLGIAGIVFFFWKFQDSFPSASIDLRYTRPQIANLARQWSQRIGYDDKGSLESTVFNPDDDAKTFLEYELGQKQANQLMKSEVPVWSWVTRFCRPFQLEDVAVALSPDGKLNYFSHSLPNDAPGTTIAHEQAEKIATNFVEKEVGKSLAGTTKMKDAETRQLHRTDHEFSWEDQTHDYKGGRLRTYVCVSGDKVTSYAQFLHVPESFVHKFAEIRSYNETLKKVSEIIFALLSSAILFIFVWAFASGRVRWPLVLTAGGIAALLSVLNWVDSTPTLVAGYQTTMSFNQYLIGKATSGLVGMLLSALATIFFVGALEPIYRMAFPEKVALEKVVSAAGLRSIQVFRSLVAGLSVFGMHTAYVVAFYLIGQHLGFWSPLEIRETSLLSNLWPFFSAIDIGVNAATMEELMYRVLALVMFRKLVKNFWLANFLQAAAWGFMHSDYPQEPAYARGVELTIGGFFYGYILRSFGLVACMLAHYTYDAFLGVTPLLSSNSLSDKLTALLAVAPGAILLALSIWFIWRRGVNADETPLLNGSLHPEHRPEPRGPQPDGHFAYPVLSKRAVFACIVGGIIGGLAFLMPVRTVGDADVVTITRRQAIEQARNYLVSKGIKIDGLQTTAVLNEESSDIELQYVLEKAGFAKTAELAKVKEPRLLWKVRFFQPKNPQEIYVSLTPDGKPFDKTMVADEDAPGNRAPQALVRAAIENFLRQEHPELQPAMLVDSTKQDRKERTDYSFTYQVPHLKVADAEFQVSIGTVGSTMSGFSRGWQIPETWTFERNRVTPKDQALEILRKVFFIALLVVVIWWGFTLVRTRQVRWRAPIILAAVTAVVNVVTCLNNIPAVFWEYKVDATVFTFAIGTLVDWLLSVLSGVAITGFSAAMALAAYRSMFPDQAPSYLIRVAWPHLGKVSEGTRRMWLDGVIVGGGFTALLAGTEHFFYYWQYLISPSVHLLGLGTIASIGDEWSPALGGILAAVSAAIATVLAVAAIASVERRFFAGSRWKFALFVIVLDLIGNSYLRYWQDYLFTVVAYAVLAAIFYVMITRVARFNVLVYPLSAYYSTLAGTVYTLVRFESFSIYYPQLAVLVLAMAAPLVYTGWLCWAPRKELEVVPPDPLASS